MSGIRGQSGLLRCNRNLVRFLKALPCVLWAVLTPQQASTLDRQSHARSHRFSGKRSSTIQSASGFVQVSL